MDFRRVVLALAVVVASAIPAFAHGGSYRGPGSSGGPGGPPPGPADDAGPITAWESWWANNKYLHLRLGEGMREAAGPTTPGANANGADAGEPPEKIREATDRLVRETLLPEFLLALEDGSFEVRTAAAVALGKCGDPLASEPLQRAAEKDDHQDVRDSALLALGLLGRPAAIPFLDGVLRDEKPTTRHRSFAAFSLGLIGGPDAAKCLLDFMKVPSGLRVRGEPQLLAACFLAMGFTGEASVLPVLREASDDGRYDDQTRALVWLALGRAGDRESVPLFVNGLAAQKTAVALQRAAAVALGRVADAKVPSATMALLGAMRDNRDPLVRHFAAISLGRMADDAIRTELRARFAKTENPLDRAFAALALGVAGDEASAPAVRKALAAEDDHSLRGAYSIVLGMLRDQGARAVLEAQVRDDGAIWPQGYAALAIGMARLRDSAPLLREKLQTTNDPRLRANLAVGLGLLRDAAAQKWFLETLRGDGTLYERGGAAMALGLLRMNEAVPALVKVWRDRKESDLLRAYSVVALGILVDPCDPPKLAAFAIDQDYSVRNDPLNEVMTIY